MKTYALLALGAALSTASATTPAQTATPTRQAAAADRPWADKTLDPDRRTALLLARMTQDEKLTLVFGYFGTPKPDKNYLPVAEARAGSAGYVPGIPRLGIPPQWQTDAGMGVATQVAAAQKRERTALPSSLSIAASWDPALAYRAGAIIGDEAWRSGFNILLGGGVNLVREPRGGRNFEYGGEDPLLAGIMAGRQVAGVQSQNVVGTLKHFAMNNQETGRGKGNSVIGDAEARMSDLLAFQIAFEQSDAGAFMCSYNRVNGTHACENPYLLTDVLRRDWGFKGFVMSDWGATHSTVAAANAGLDQQSGHPFDDAPYFAAPLKAALTAGTVRPATLDRMAGGVLHAMFASGLFDRPVTGETAIDYAAHATITRDAAARGAVLLRNERSMLPLSPAVRSIVVVGGHADKGVLAGGGSSLVYPRGGNAVPGLQPTGWPGPVVYYPSSPLEAIRARAPNARVTWLDGRDPAAAAAAARAADVAIVFATQWTAESHDTDIALEDGQDALIAAVADANPRTTVVLETGGAVLTPWADRTAAILEVWYPGTNGAPAIADLLFGVVAPSGRLPVTFPASPDQMVRPGPIDPRNLRGAETADVRLSEGAAVGYKWFERQRLTPRFAFGHGLTYTRFTLGALTVAPRGDGVVARFTVRNAGQRRGVAVPQLYVSPVAGGWEAPKRLGGWQTVDLPAGVTRQLTVTIDPRLLATFDPQSRRWRIAAGRYTVALAQSSSDIAATTIVTLAEHSLPVGWRP